MTYRLGHAAGIISGSYQPMTALILRSTVRILHVSSIYTGASFAAASYCTLLVHIRGSLHCYNPEP